MKVSDVMTGDVKIADPERSVRDAAHLMAKADAGALPVGENDRLIGMITDRDIVVRVLGADKNPGDTKIRDAMTPEVEYCFDDEELPQVAEKMAQIKVRRLVVLNRKKRIVGVVSIGDLALKGSPAVSGRAMRGSAQPGGPHAQTT